MRKATKNLVRVLFVFCALIVSAGIANAHAASNVALSYTPTDGFLEITATHHIRSDKEESAREHFIKEYVIEVNDNVVKRVYQQSQLDDTKSVAKVFLPNLEKGSVVKVTAICNKTGVNSEEITIN